MRNTLITLSAAVLLAGCATRDASTPTADSRGDAVMADSEARATEVVERPATSTSMSDILAMPHRSEANRARDAHRHPQETLTFFEVHPHQAVVEVTPGGGWYTEILAPFLRTNGHLVAQVFDPAAQDTQRSRDYYTKSNTEFRAKLAANAGLYDRVSVIETPASAPVLGAPSSVDRVLTFRNVHNWTAAKNDAAMFKAFFDVLKPDGILGVVEHRAAPGTDPAVSATSGYITEAYVIELATAAGFELAGRSEVNANPKDTRDHKNGVWTLPPVLRVPEGDDASKYKAIGESDRMTLKFVKPAR